MPSAHKVDLDEKEAKKFFASAETRVVDGHPQIKHDGVWKKLARTDLMDDIRTSISFTTDKAYHNDPVGYYVKRCHFGIRFGKHAVYVIDAYSDG